MNEQFIKQLKQKLARQQSKSPRSGEQNQILQKNNIKSPEEQKQILLTQPPTQQSGGGALNIKEEIEKRFQRSLANKIYIFPRKINDNDDNLSVSSDSSLMSIKNATIYNLHAQNNSYYTNNHQQQQIRQPSNQEFFTYQENNFFHSPDKKDPQNQSAKKNHKRTEQFSKRLKTEGNEAVGDIENTKNNLNFDNVSEQLSDDVARLPLEQYNHKKNNNQNNILEVFEDNIVQVNKREVKDKENMFSKDGSGNSFGNGIDYKKIKLIQPAIRNTYSQFPSNYGNNINNLTIKNIRLSTRVKTVEKHQQSSQQQQQQQNLKSQNNNSSVCNDTRKGQDKSRDRTNSNSRHKTNSTYNAMNNNHQNQTQISFNILNSFTKELERYKKDHGQKQIEKKQDKTPLKKLGTDSTGITSSKKTTFEYSDQEIKNMMRNSHSLHQKNKQSTSVGRKRNNNDTPKHQPLKLIYNNLIDKNLFKDKLKQSNQQQKMFSRQNILNQFQNTNYRIQTEPNQDFEVPQQPTQEREISPSQVVNTEQQQQIRNSRIQTSSGSQHPYNCIKNNSNRTKKPNSKDYDWFSEKKNLLIFDKVEKLKDLLRYNKNK